MLERFAGTYDIDHEHDGSESPCGIGRFIHGLMIFDSVAQRGPLALKIEPKIRAEITRIRDDNEY